MRFLLTIPLLFALGVLCFLRTAVFQSEATFWTDAVAESPNKARPYNNLGRTHLVSGRYEQALPFILKALILDPDYRDARLNLAIFFYDRGKKREAEREFSQIVERYGRTSDVSFELNMARNIRAEIVGR